ncbi:uncharacterized protein LOC121916784 [Sceloporus undulatus]|uniref:uncharacterized protein LOC121916784 n=1 Tax=Sceloporus undulatus TaxID=8520 RepID=UPI001C4D16F4|nr:uncharacterized protein LOC121916784 [Sceloporus undulatus]
MSAGGGCEGGAAPGGEGLLQRTQVVLLSGEPWGLEGGQTVLGSFAQRPLGASSPGAAGAAAGGGQLVFFLCRASSLGGACPPPSRLREALEGLRAQLRGSPPSVLVGVVVQPPPEQEAQALQRLQGLLRETFPEGQQGPELHAALFAPGRPQGALRIQRLAPPDDGPRPRDHARTLWPDKSLLMQVLGAALSFGTIAYGSYYFYSHPPL